MSMRPGSFFSGGRSGRSAPLTSTPSRHPGRVSSSSSSMPSFISSPGDMYSFQAEEPHENNVAPTGVEDLVAEQSAEISELRSVTAGCKEQILQQQLQLEAMKQQLQQLSSGIREGQRKERVPRRLSNLMDDVYKALPVSFTLNERLDAEHNRRVKESLFSQFQQAQHSYDEKLVQRAVIRLFEKLKRQWRDSLPENQEKAMVEEKKRRKSARQKRLYIRRTKYVSANEREKWADVDKRFMSEESSADEVTHDFNVHKVTWRSQELDELIATLDSRYHADVATGSNYRPPIKQRRVASPVGHGPPLGIAQWTVEQD